MFSLKNWASLYFFNRLAQMIRKGSYSPAWTGTEAIAVLVVVGCSGSTAIILSGSRRTNATAILVIVVRGRASTIVGTGCCAARAATILVIVVCGCAATKVGVCCCATRTATILIIVVRSFTSMETTIAILPNEALPIMDNQIRGRFSDPSRT